MWAAMQAARVWKRTSARAWLWAAAQGIHTLLQSMVPSMVSLWSRHSANFSGLAWHGISWSATPSWMEQVPSSSLRGGRWAGGRGETAVAGADAVWLSEWGQVAASQSRARAGRVRLHESRCAFAAARTPSLAQLAAITH